MSYFMTVTGPQVDVSGIGSVELVDAKNAQDYIRSLAAKFIAQDGGQDLYLVHDGETGTSHELIGAAINALYEGMDFATTDFSNVLT